MGVSDFLVIDGKRVADAALELLGALMRQLSASVALEDVQLDEAHIKMSTYWFSASNTAGQGRHEKRRLRTTSRTARSRSGESRTAIER